MILNVEFCPPVEYFTLIAEAAAGGERVVLDAAENYHKQTYRNRCRILSANGILDLRFPIVHDGSKAIGDVRVDYSTPWVPKFKVAVESAYSSAPYYIYYKDEFFAILDSRPETLLDLDMALMGFFCRKTGLPCPELSSTAGQTGADFRDAVHPKKPPVFRTREYWQVFRERFGFVSGLSVMDLLFNEGPESLDFMRRTL